MSEPVHTSTTAVPLLPSWDAVISTTHGLFTLGDGIQIPSAWEPKPSDYDPKAIPTPFARAEALRLVLARIDEAKDHPYAVHFRWLLLGVAAGVLELEADDFGSERYDNLGRALRQVDPDARYFCRLIGPAGAPRSYGITYRSSMFSPHARRAASEWNELADAIKPRETQALALLSDWREALKRAGRWSPNLPGCDWQRGVDHVIGSVASSSASLERLREDARFVGPIWLCLPTGIPEQPVRQEPVYLPSLALGHAARFVKTCQLQPRDDAASAGIIFLDSQRKPAGLIRLPSAGAETNAIAVGMGLLAFPDAPMAPPTSHEMWVTAQGGQPGLVDLLRPVVLALQKIGRPVDAAHVNGCPPLYPDPIRILVDRGLWPDVGGGRKAQSRRMTAALMIAGGRALDSATIDREGGETVALGGEAEPVMVTLLDRLGETEVLDLRALGYVMWSVFVGDAEVAEALEGQLAMSDTLEKLLEHTRDRPLEPRKSVYDHVSVAPSPTLGCRVATMQRFVQAYRSGAAGLPRLLDRAARSFVVWASGLSSIVPLGRPVARFLSYRLPTGEELRLALDACEN